jgi:hypothetical protein
MLLCLPGNIHVQDDGSGAFSPVPMEISCVGKERIYRSCLKEGRHRGREATFTSEDLESKIPKNSGPLHGNVHSELLLTEAHFETHEKVLMDHIKSKYVFDHDFLYLSIRFVSTVLHPSKRY